MRCRSGALISGMRRSSSTTAAARAPPLPHRLLTSYSLTKLRPHPDVHRVQAPMTCKMPSPFDGRWPRGWKSRALRLRRQTGVAQLQGRSKLRKRLDQARMTRVFVRWTRDAPSRRPSRARYAPQSSTRCVATRHISSHPCTLRSAFIPAEHKAQLGSVRSACLKAAV